MNNPLDASEHPVALQTQSTVIMISSVYIHVRFKRCCPTFEYASM